MLTWSFLKAVSYETAKEKGWFDPPKSFGEEVLLMHSELSEVVEEFRKGADVTAIRFVDCPLGKPEDGKPEGIPIEFADLVIRLATVCAHYNIDIEDALYRKTSYNKTRPHRHGGKIL